MWEFLYEIQNADNLTDVDRIKIREIFRHYPSASEIRLWAVQESKKKRRFLEPEEPQPLDENIPDDIQRGPTTPTQRAQSINDAQTLLRYDNLDWSSGQRREISFILRHFPSDEGADAVSVERATFDGEV
jgi:hypothetical protein